MFLKKNGKLSLLLKIIIVAVSVIALLLVSVAVINAIVKGTAAESVFSSADELDAEKTYDCVLILGAGLKSDGTPSHMLEDRIKTGISVFESVNADCILMSGDRSGEDYDEPGAMKKYAESLGIDADYILIDNSGFSTYESIVRAKEIYGFDNVIVITQEYHLYRALYIAEKQEIDAVGVSADLRTYRGQIFREMREVLARVKDFLQS